MLQISPQSTALRSAVSADAEVHVDALVALCKASADQLRLQVLRVLQQDSLGVLELCTLFNIRQPAMSHHLKVLAGAGLVASRRDGNSIFYRRAGLGQQPGLAHLQSALFDTLDQLPLPTEVEQHLREMHLERERSSRRFFEQNADKFRAQQDLIASYTQYADTVTQFLADAPLRKRQLALEVGPGDGAFLASLAPGFEQVIALDNSEQMLEQTRRFVAERGLSNVRCELGDTRHKLVNGLGADCIVVNMVLHHTPSPAEILADLAAALAPGGVLLVTDLCQHDQEWAREACGDMWLGFDPAELQAWAHAAGLNEISSVYLAQRNGFQIQVRLFGHPTS